MAGLAPFSFPHVPLWFDLCTMLPGIFVGVPIFRLACHYAGVKVPSWPRALAIVAITGLATVLIYFPLRLAVNKLLGAAAWNPLPEQSFACVMIAMTLMLPIDWLVAAGLYSWFLRDVTYGQGFLIYFAQIVIVLAILLTLVGVAFVLFAALMAFG